jgi:glycogen operon protein
VAERVELCLFDEAGVETRVPLPSGTPSSGTATCPTSARAALRLPRARALRPGHGHRCNGSKLLLDPYAKAVDGNIDWAQACFSYTWGDQDSFNDEDSART